MTDADDAKANADYPLGRQLDMADAAYVYHTLRNLPVYDRRKGQRRVDRTCDDFLYGHRRVVGPPDRRTPADRGKDQRESAAATNVLGQLHQKGDGTPSGLNKETTGDVSGQQSDSLPSSAGSGGRPPVREGGPMSAMTEVDAFPCWMVDYENAEDEPQHAVLSWLNSDPTTELPEVGEILVRQSDARSLETRLIAAQARAERAEAELAALRAKAE